MVDFVDSDVENVGLGNTPKSQWPKAPSAEVKTLPIDRLAPGSELHATVLQYLLERLTRSERAMKAFYDRWRFNEMRLQAYINLGDWEKKLKALNDAGEPPSAVSITVPYAYATISTIVTYMIHTFAGRRPMFQVASNSAEGVGGAHSMELLIQFNADHTKLMREMFQWLWDGETYGVGVMRTGWKRIERVRTVFEEPEAKPGFFGGLFQGKQEKVRMRKKVLAYSGNFSESIDPYMFFPDPGVAMCKVNEIGEFVFWRKMEGKHLLLVAEADGVFKHIKSVGTLPSGGLDQGASSSNRSLLSQGEPTPGVGTEARLNSIQLDQGSVEIIPAELGLSSSTVPEKWLFTIANKTQIIQAEPLEMDHGKHPVSVIEPYTLGYGFGQPALLDFLGSIQDTISWFINSHIHNVRSALNNMFVVDPTRVEMQDLKRPGPGKLIRVKRAAFGQDVRTMLQQLQVTDVTSSHIDDTQTMMRLADMLSAVSDNVRGLQSAGGRKTATEVRVGAEAGASRLAAHTRLVSAQGVVDLTEQMSINLQQFSEKEVELAVLGQDGMNNPIRLSPEHVVGDFYYPVHDGTLPMDKVALLDVWQQILLGVARDPELRQTFSLVKIFEHVAELGGAKNIENFRNPPQPQLNVQPDAQVDAEAAAGNIVPLGATPQLPGARPSSRAAGGP